TIDTDTLKQIDYLIINEVEAAAIATKINFTENNMAALARHIADHFDLICILTLGAEGVVVAENKSVFSIPALPLDVIDTTGAGDAFVGALAAALNCGENIENAVRQGVIAGSLACTKIGAQASLPDQAQIQNVFEKL